MPAFNEEKTIAYTIDSLLGLNYPEYEIIVINDGSTDSTLETVCTRYSLTPRRRVYQRRLPTAEVRGIYASEEIPGLILIDKENGGKSDALNTGINVAKYPLVCSIDADSVLDSEALAKVVMPLLEDPQVVAATGGIVRVANGCEFQGNKVARLRLPSSKIACFQVVEYIRAFLMGRTAWSRFNMLLIVSGAFGVFRKDMLVDVGGYGSDTITEDLEIIFRLHRHFLERKIRYRISFVPEPVLWTEVPENMRVLSRQRNRWHRGLLQTLVKYRVLAFNPRFGAIGLMAAPYYLVFDGIGPFIEIAGYASVALALGLGILNFEFAAAFLLVAVVYGFFVSLASILFNELASQSPWSSKELFTLLLFCLLENLGYRQIQTWFRFKATLDFALRRKGWGTMPRKGLAANGCKS